jgi:hypothetical protein
MISLSQKPFRLWRKIAERIVLSLVVLFAAILALSSAYNAIAMEIFWATHPAPGSFLPGEWPYDASLLHWERLANYRA